MSEVVEPSAAMTEDRAGLRALVAGAMAGLHRLPMLRAVTERLAAALSTNIRKIFGADAEVRVDPAQSLRLQEFQARITPGAPIALLRVEPWGGRCFAALDAGMTATAIELLLGGRRGPGGNAERRSYTAIERAVVERLAREVVARDLATAFAPAGAEGITFERLETDGARLVLGKPTAPAIALRAEIRVDDCAGCIDFLVPYTAIEPMRDRLSHDPDRDDRDGDAVWRAHLTAELPLAHVELRAVIERRRVQAADILRWQVGSKLALSRRHDEPIDLLCNDVLVLRGRIAEKDGRIALHIEERRIADDWPIRNSPMPDPPTQDSPTPE